MRIAVLCAVLKGYFFFFFRLFIFGRQETLFPWPNRVIQFKTFLGFSFPVAATLCDHPIWKCIARESFYISHFFFFLSPPFFIFFGRNCTWRWFQIVKVFSKKLAWVRLSPLESTPFLLHICTSPKGRQFQALFTHATLLTTTETFYKCAVHT